MREVAADARGRGVTEAGFPFRFECGFGEVVEVGEAVRSWARVRAPMDARLAAEVQSSVGPKRLSSAHFPVIASVTRARVCGELIPDGVS